MIKVNVYSDGSVFIEAKGKNTDTGDNVIVAKSYSCIESAGPYIEGYRELLGQNVSVIHWSDEPVNQVTAFYNADNKDK